MPGGHQPDPMTESQYAGLAEQMSRYRSTREHIERNTLALATSLDGESFEVQASMHDLQLRRGGYVMLEGERRTWLGEITDLRSDSATVEVDTSPGASARVLIRVAHGAGRVLDPDGTTFHDAAVRPALPQEVGAWFEQTRHDRAGLTVGELVFAPGVAAEVDGDGLNRHTFMCGQSGSGKTYSLGLLLEQVLAETTLRVVILDPNSDYVGLGQLREDADPGVAGRYRDVMGDVQVWGGSSADQPLRMAFAGLTPDVQAASPRSRPDPRPGGVRRPHGPAPDERERNPTDFRPDQLLQADTTGARALGKRAANLGVLDWEIWSPDQRSLLDELRSPTARCTVVDLGSLGTVQEQQLVAAAVLSELWAKRLSREPCLVVIDEAHNICPAEPSTRTLQISTDQTVQIAAEGRKYGLYLLTSTQRPNKVHENVTSQCDNLLLMRMNSQADVADLGRLFSFVPPGLMAGASSFRMGQALVAGKFFRQAGYVQMGARVSREGGTASTDVGGPQAGLVVRIGATHQRVVWRHPPLRHFRGRATERGRDDRRRPHWGHAVGPPGRVHRRGRHGGRGDLRAAGCGRARWPARPSGSRSCSPARSRRSRATRSPSSARATPRVPASWSTSCAAFGNGHITGVVGWLLLAANAIITAMVAVSFGSYARRGVRGRRRRLDQDLRRARRAGR